MTNSTFSIFSSIFGFVVAVISLLAFIIKICRSHLPSNKIRILETLLDETEMFFNKAIEDGLLIEPEFVHETERHLAILRTRTYVLRASAYNATTLCKNYTELLNGTSSAIGRTCDSLRKLRAQVVTSSEEGRRKRTAMDSVSHANSSPAISPLSPDTERHTKSLSPAEIPRPHSCPPTLSGSILNDVQCIPTERDPFNDPIQGSLDVRTVDAQCCAPAVHTSSTLEPGT